MLFRFFLWVFVSLASSTPPPLAVTSTDQILVEILNGSSAAAIQSGDEIRIYFQAPDNSIHEWRSFTPNSQSYLDTFLVAGNKVKADSPLAAVGELTWILGERSVYYISLENYIRGYCWQNSQSSWHDCGINDAMFSVKPGSNYLYAVAVPNGPVRVGYQCISGSICEATSRQGVDWHTREV